MTTPAVLILAAGQSSRMRGSDKLMQDVDGVPLLRRQAERALRFSRDVTVALPPAPHPRHDALKGLDVTCTTFPGSAEGMNGTLRDGIAALSDRGFIMVMLADLPDIDTEDLQAVWAAADAHPDMAIWRGSTADGKAGHPILLSHETYPAFAKLGGDGGGREAVGQYARRTALVPLPGSRARADLDTPEDWAAWRARRS